MTSWTVPPRLRALVAPTVDSLRLHAALHDECRRAVQQLVAGLREPSLRRVYVDALDGFACAIAAGDGPGEAAHRVLSALDDGPVGLLRCAGVLKSLDGHHRGEQAVFRGEVATLPEAFGGASVLFLPPPTFH